MKKNKAQYRPAVFIVVYRKIKDNKDKIGYLLLKRKLHWNGWEFPKGKIEEEESKARAAAREAHEESGLKIGKIRKFNVSGKYLYTRRLPDRPDYIGQTYSLFSGEAINGMGKIKLDKREHSGFKWLPFDEAVRKLKWQNQKKCLRIVDKSLN